MALLSWSRIRTVHALLFGGNTEGEALRLFADNHGGGLRVIDQAHVKTHEGEMYVTGNIFSLASGANGDIIFTTGATKFIHIAAKFSSNAQGRFFMYEGPTFSGGTAIVPINTNRISTNTAQPTLVHTPTVTAVGTLLHDDVVPGGSGGNAQGGSGGGYARGIEFNLKASTSYLFRFTNDGNGTENTSTSIGFYEDDT